MRKVMVLPGAFSSLIISMFKSHGYEPVAKLDDQVDLLVFSGGEDVDPFFYNHDKHKTTYSNFSKDQREIDQYLLAQEFGIPCVGICRGGQLLHIMNGGTMWQDVNMHGRDHMAKTHGTNIEVLLSSMHHQMLMPNSKTENILLLTAHEATKKAKMSALDDQARHTPLETVRYVSKANPDEDIEALYYPETNCLCFQPHPELSVNEHTGKYKPMVDLFFSYIEQYSFDKDVT